MAPISRRTFAAFLATAVLTPVLGGCSSSTCSSAGGEGAATTAGGAFGADAAEGAATRTVDTDKGPVEIPTNLQTIVSDYYLGEFLAVDVKPVIASPYALNNPFLAGLCDGIEALNTTSAETSLEMIVTITEADYDKYAKIAPTVYIADGTRTDEDLFRYIADLVGKKDAAEAYIAEFNDKVATVKDEIVGIVGNRTVSILEVWPQEIYTMGSHFARGGSILYDMWGLKAPEAIQGPMVDGDEAYKVISVEALPDYAGDFICYGVLDGADSAYVDDSQLWKNLPAVQAGRLMPYEQVAFMHRDPITLTNQLETFTDFFRAHADTAA